MDTPSLVVVTNATAGSASDDAVAAVLDVLRRSASVSVSATSSPAELDEVVAGRPAGARLVVLGGDGSLHSVAEALDRAGALNPGEPVAAVPLGTGNDLARCLGIPLEPEQAARVALTGRPRRLDVLVDERGRLVVNGVHAGVGAEAAANADPWKERLGAAGYAVGSVIAGATATGWHLRVEVDGAVVADGGPPLLMVGLGIGTSVGGGALLAPDAVPDDGLVDVVLVGSVGPLARLGFAVRLAGDGDHVERDDVRTVRGRSVAVTAVGAEDAFRTNADGEVEGPFTFKRWRVRPQAWSVLVP